MVSVIFAMWWPVWLHHQLHRVLETYLSWDLGKSDIIGVDRVKKTEGKFGNVELKGYLREAPGEIEVSKGSQLRDSSYGEV